VGECFFWYRPTRVVPDQRPLNGRCITATVIIGFYAANGASSTLVKELRDIVRAKFYCPYHMPLQIKHNNCYLGLHDTSPQQLAHLD